MTHTKDIVRDNLMEALQKSYLDGLMTESEYQFMKEEIEEMVNVHMEIRAYKPEPQNNDSGYYATLQTIKEAWN